MCSSLANLVLRLPQRKSVNSAAYDYYLRGKVNAGSENRENNENAIQLLEQAIAADPDFAPAYAELAEAYVSSVLLRVGGRRKS